MNLVQLTPEGKIVMELAAGAKSYTELKRFTKLSDRWLSKKLKELQLVWLSYRTIDTA